MHALRLLPATVTAAVLVGAAGLGAIDTAAHADPPGGTTCQTQSTYSAGCVVQVQQPVNPNDPNNPNQPIGSTGDTGPACYFNPSPQNLGGQGHTVPCTSTYGTWSNSYNCYVKRLTPQPDASDPAWQGHQPGDGAIYSCYQPQTGHGRQHLGRQPAGGPGSRPPRPSRSPRSRSRR